MIKKPTRINHNKTITIVNNLIRGETLRNSFTPEGLFVGVTKTGIGVTVAVDVLVFKGNINVMGGRGINVVVGVSEGVAEGVNVCDGVLDVPVGVCEFILVVEVTLARSSADEI
jgi:hypothetical protein